MRRSEIHFNLPISLFTMECDSPYRDDNENENGVQTLVWHLRQSKLWTPIFKESLRDDNENENRVYSSFAYSHIRLFSERRVTQCP
jgi:hypothetical protein